MTTSNKVRHIHLWLSENTALSVSKGFSLFRSNIDDIQSARGLNLCEHDAGSDS